MEPRPVDTCRPGDLEAESAPTSSELVLRERVSAGARFESACRSIQRAAPLLFQIVHGESKPRPAPPAIGDGADPDP